MLDYEFMVSSETLMAATKTVTPLCSWTMWHVVVLHVNMTEQHQELTLSHIRLPSIRCCLKRHNQTKISKKSKCYFRFLICS